jgi:hypothetical protein
VAPLDGCVSNCSVANAGLSGEVIEDLEAFEAVSDHDLRAGAKLLSSNALEPESEKPSLREFGGDVR